MRAEADVIEQCFKKREAAPVAVELFGLFHTAEFAAGSVLRILWFHAAVDIFFGKSVKVCTQFGVELAIQLAPAKNPQEA